MKHEDMNFKEYPESLTEAMASQPNEWTPRDALISMLREIDKGEIEIETLVIGYFRKDGKTWGWRVSSPDRRLVPTLLEDIKTDFIG